MNHCTCNAHLLAAGLTLCAGLFQNSCAQAGTVTQGLIGYWPFDGNSLNDFSGHNNHVLPIDPKSCPGTFVQGVTGISRSISSCGGLAVGSPEFYSQTSELSISFWLNASSNQDQAYNALVYRANRVADAPSVGWIDRTIAIFWVHSGGLHLVYTSNNATHQEECFNHSLGLAENTWHHIVATLHSPTQTAKFYVNGVVVETCSMLGQALMSGTEELYFGQTFNTQLSDTGGFNGALDQIRYYDRAINGDEVAQIYEDDMIGLVFRDGFEQ